MKIKINFFSDTICGWCYIGHARLMKAIQSFHNINFEIEHIPFQLNPEMPREGIDREYYLQMKFGGKENAQPMYDHMVQEGIKEGLNINLENSIIINGEAFFIKLYAPSKALVSPPSISNLIIVL